MTMLALSALVRARSSRPARLLRNFSTPSNSSQDKREEKLHKQPFVKIRLKAGEWDPKTRTNPLYKPKFRSKAKIWSNDDFQNQPTVGFSSEYDNFSEAQVVLSWLSRADHSKIYDTYVQIMEKNDSPRTSHEYVVRVVAQIYRITPERAAGVIQLQHNEHQLLRAQQKDGKQRVFPDVGEEMDRTIQEEIKDAYKAFSETAPNEFVEDPVHVGKENPTFQTVDDLYDADEIWKDAIVRERNRARLTIDEYVYEEDVDEDTISIPLSDDCRDLLKAKPNLSKPVQEAEKHLDATPPGNGERRPRWKYVAQVVNTREMKKKNKAMGRRRKGKNSTSYQNNDPTNTLVEEDGQLRAANRADVQQTSWKSVRHVCEHTYKGVKQGWLDRRIRGDMEAWGKAPDIPFVPEVEDNKKASAELEDGSPDDPEPSSENGNEEQDGVVVPEEQAQSEEKHVKEDVPEVDESSDGNKQN